jgi:proline dehydrogenase
MALRQGFLTLSNSKGLQSFAMHNPLARRVARRFVAGEELNEAVAAIRRLNSRGITATFDRLGESVTDEREARAAAESYGTLLDAIQQNGIRSNVSLKLTAMGLDLDPEFCYRNVRAVVEKARDLNNFVRIDMEDSNHAQATFDIFYRLHNEFPPHVGIVVQAYLYRTWGDVDELIARKARVRLCKGAYNEPPTVAFPEKADVDKNYARLMHKLMMYGTYPALATHDARLITHAQQFAAKQQIGTDRFEFQMLYGIRTQLQDQLAAEGYNMRVYVPYGEQWYPYFMRRLAERPANALFVLGNLVKR